MGRKGRRRPLRVVAVVTGVFLALGVWGPGASPAVLPKLSVAAVTVVEQNSGTIVAVVPVTLDVPAVDPVSVGFTTVDSTATVADGDYLAASGTLIFPPGTSRQDVRVTVNGDTKLEDYQVFLVRLSGATNAAIAVGSGKVTIANDEKPRLAAGAVKVVEGQVATFKPRLAQRYYQPITVSAQTVNGTATTPPDYGAATRSLTFPAGSLAAVPVAVSTVSDAVIEGNETFNLRVSGGGVVAAVTPKATISEAASGCPGGTPTAAPTRSAPPSPSSPPTLGPPAGVTGGTAWDLMFHDEFDDSAVTAAQWDTGMRSGARTLEGNQELQWYTSANSTLTTDSDAGGSLGVLSQRLTAATTTSDLYTVRTLSRLYPPDQCPELYHAGQLAPTDLTKVPYRFKSGMLNSAESFGFRYGYVEARVKLPKGHALWPAIWMRNWGPWSYEIDVMEGFDSDARVARGTVWWGNGSHIGTNNEDGDLGLKSGGAPCAAWPPLRATSTNPAECTFANALDLSAGYHTFGMHWSPGGYRMYIDGVLRWTAPAGTPVDDSFNHLIINLAFANNQYEFDWLSVPIRPLDGDVLTSGWFPKPTVEWDYVRVWQAPNAHAVCTTGNC